MTDFSGVNYIRGKKGLPPIKSGVFEPEKQTKDENIYDFIKNTPDKFKSLTNNHRLKVLFYYMKMKTNNGMYKKESLRVIGEYFSVGKDTIAKLIKELKETGYIKELTEISEIDLQKLKDNSTYYKLLKEDY